MASTRARLVAAFCIAGAAGLFGLHALGADQAALRMFGMGTEAPDDPALADATTLDWLDLIPPEDVNSAVRLHDGSLPRGIVQHGELGPTNAEVPPEADNIVPDPANPAPPDLARSLGAFSDLYSPPRRLSDTLGGIGNLKALQPNAVDIRADLDGKEVRIAGFVTPLAFSGDKISDFLLVPYVGACIHVPPPPANQIVLISGVKGFRPDGDLLYPVWVVGKLRAVPLETDLANVGYQIEGAKVEPYD